MLSRGTREAVEKTAGPMGDMVALDDYRSYAPGMCLGRQFSSGPSNKHEPWKVEVVWGAYLRLIAEVVRIIYGLQGDPTETGTCSYSKR